ncbi:hypothetical protein EIP91_009499 [Steccherinum ochraceum]|uniref:Uncharacterized protein n=1 Tax=Steccherinum ochraceum TaxID=92696 RepID=A0A4R0REE4_9APHY|nr:hypothetical protein EIP91_009499 [Steccherinum ochraceum]
MLTPRTASSTRTRIKTERQFKPERQLRSIAYFADFAVQAHKLLWEVEGFKEFAHAQADKSMMQAVHPLHTGSGLPSILRSEVDTADWVLAKFIWPAVHVLNEFLASSKSEKITDDVVTFGSSESSQGVGIPDGISRRNGKTDAVYEWKTHNAMRDHMFDGLSTSLAELMKYNIGTRVWWGEGLQGKEQLTKETKIIFQVWGQIAARDEELKRVKFGCLSSFKETYLFFRDVGLDGEDDERPGAQNRLFMSPGLKYHEVTVLDFVAFLALAHGISGSKSTKFTAPEIKPGYSAYSLRYIQKKSRSLPPDAPSLVGIDKRPVVPKLERYLKRKEWLALNDIPNTVTKSGRSISAQIAIEADPGESTGASELESEDDDDDEESPGEIATYETDVSDDDQPTVITDPEPEKRKETTAGELSKRVILGTPRTPPVRARGLQEGQSTLKPPSKIQRQPYSRVRLPAMPISRDAEDSDDDL